MTLTKFDIVEDLVQQLGLTNKECTQLVESTIEIIKKTLASSDDILISGFGKFCVNQKRERKGRNPATGQTMMLPERKVVTFKSSGILRNRVNGNK